MNYKLRIAILLISFSCNSLCCSVNPSTAPIVTSWKKCNGTTNGIVNNIQSVKYSNNYVYTYAASIPDYTIGPWPGNPDTASDQRYTFKFPLNPTAATTKTKTPLGHIGQFLNGVTAYNALDAQSYNNQGIWNRNAGFWESGGFDACKGHPSPSGEYHHHVNPICLYTMNSSLHSSIIGFAFDGYPIYGIYAYSQANNTNSNITRMRTGYKLRSIAQRTTLPDGTSLSASQYGPTINSTYPLGAYIEDYEYVSGYGDLDEYNGRYCKTPEYPNGTYAYFVTVDAAGTPEYPFIIGPKFYGSPETANLGFLAILIGEVVLTQLTCNAALIAQQIPQLIVCIALSILFVKLFKRF